MNIKLYFLSIFLTIILSCKNPGGSIYKTNQDQDTLNLKPLLEMVEYQLKGTLKVDLPQRQLSDTGGLFKNDSITVFVERSYNLSFLNNLEFSLNNENFRFDDSCINTVEKPDLRTFQLWRLKNIWVFNFYSTDSLVNYYIYLDSMGVCGHLNSRSSVNKILINGLE